MKKRFLMILLLTGVMAPSAVIGKDVTVKDVKDSANEVLDGVDKGVHTAGREAKKGGNSLLQSMDDAIKRFFHGSGEKKAESVGTSETAEKAGKK